MRSASKVQIWSKALYRIGNSRRIESESENNTEAKICRDIYSDLLTELIERHPWKWATRDRTISEISTQDTTTACDGAQVDFEVPYGYVTPDQVSVYLVSSGGSETLLTAVDDYTITTPQPGINGLVTTVATYSAPNSIKTSVSNTRTGWDFLYILPADCVTPLAFLYEGQRYILTVPQGRIDFDIMANDAGDGLLLGCNLAATEFDSFQYIAAIDNVTVFPAQFVDALTWRLAQDLASAIPKKTNLSEYCRSRFEESVSRAWANDRKIGFGGIEAQTPELTIRGAAWYGQSGFNWRYGGWPWS